MDADPRVEKRDVFDYEPMMKEFDTRFWRGIAGFIVYFIAVVIAVPTFLYRTKRFTILEAYLPNVDLIATVLSFVGGPALIFRDLYVPTTYTQMQFVYQAIVNFIALCGLTFLVARETKRTGSISKGWSIAFVMILATYLLPSQLISTWLERLYTVTPSKYASFAAGMAMVAVIILLERTIIDFSRKHLETLAKRLIG